LQLLITLGIGRHNISLAEALTATLRIDRLLLIRLSAAATLEMGHHICLGIRRHKIALAEALTATLRIDRLLLMMMMIRLSAATLVIGHHICLGIGRHKIALAEALAATTWGIGRLLLLLLKRLSTTATLGRCCHQPICLCKGCGIASATVGSLFLIELTYTTLH
jgi:hypothetical protein